jgi:hypothetical protein
VVTPFSFLTGEQNEPAGFYTFLKQGKRYVNKNKEELKLFVYRYKIEILVLSTFETVAGRGPATVSSCGGGKCWPDKMGQISGRQVQFGQLLGQE